jgi:hypothetical protein
MEVVTYKVEDFPPFVPEVVKEIRGNPAPFLRKFRCPEQGKDGKFLGSAKRFIPTNEFCKSKIERGFGISRLKVEAVLAELRKELV